MLLAERLFDPLASSLNPILYSFTKNGIMQTKTKHHIYRLPVAAAIVVLAAVACNNGDYKTSDNKNSPDSSTAVTNPAAASTPAGQPAATAPAATQPASGGGDTIDNMGHVRPSTSALSPSATNPDKQGVAKSGAATPTTHTAGVHNRKRATTSIVVAERMAGATAPKFPGGQKALDNYVNDHINYPQEAIDNDVAGIVRVSFVVDENGHITKARLVNPRKVGEGLDEEALRVVSTMPEWKPATLHGKKVRTRLELPISFQVAG